MGLFAWEMRERRRVGRWLRSLSGRKHKNAAIVSLANKLARLVWAVGSDDKLHLLRHQPGDECDIATEPVV